MIRDEIWFAAENPNHESEIYSLYELRREDNESSGEIRKSREQSCRGLFFAYNKSI